MRKFLKMLSLALVACMLLSMIPVAAFAEAEQQSYTDKYGTWIYTVDDNGEITIVGYEGTTKNIVVPRKIGDMWVVALGNAVFKGNEHVCAVDIPAGVKSIGDEVFADCPKLEQVRLPLGLETIGDSAFQNCDSLTELYIPASVTEIGASAFAESDSLVVKCGASSYAAEYLMENKEEVNAFTLIEVAPVDNSGNTVLGTATGAVPELEDFSPVAPEKEPTPVTPDEDTEEAEDTEGTEGEEPETPEEEEPFERTVPDGEKVTYRFGKNNEYTLVLVDTKPTMDIGRYLVYDYDHKNYSIDRALLKEMADRYFVVSLTCGSETIIDLTTDAEIWCEGTSIEEVYTGSEMIPEIVYFLDVERYLGEKDTEDYPREMVFDSKNNLLKYSEFQWSNKRSTIEKEDTYTLYRVNNQTGTEYKADGTVIKDFDSFFKSIDRGYGYQENDYDVSIRFEENKEQYETGSVVNTDNRNLSVFKVISDHEQLLNHGHVYREMDEAGNPTWIQANQGTYIEEYENEDDPYEIIVAEKNSQAYLNKAGEITEYHKHSWVPVEDGIYHTEYFHYYKDDVYSGTRTNYWKELDSEGTAVTRGEKIDYVSEDVNRINYDEIILHAKDVNEAQELDNDHFTNNPDEHYEDISERYVNLNTHKEDRTITDLDTNKVRTEQGLAKWEELQDHTYVGETGKYVGWDWYWFYDLSSLQDEGTLNYYQVTEYTYEKGNDTWKKTETFVRADQVSDPSVDFKNVFPKEILDDYRVSVEYFVFDDSDATGKDNWKSEGGLDMRKNNRGDEIVALWEEDENGMRTTIADMRNGNANYGDVPVEELTGMRNDVFDIIAGDSTVSDGKGNTISQAEKKEDMLELEEELLASIDKIDPEGLYKEVLDMVPNGDGAALEKEVHEETIPESNVTDEPEGSEGPEGEEVKETVNETKSLASATDLKN